MESVILGVDTDKPVAMAVEELKDGMVLVSDVTTKDGILMINKGLEINAAVKNIILNFERNHNIRLPIMVEAAE